MYIKPDGTVGGGLPPLDKQKFEKQFGTTTFSEPNMVMESKEEVIDTIAKKDFDKTSLIQNMCVGCPPNYLFRIKKGDPIQVIKTTNVGTLQTDVFYDLRKHNGQVFAKIKSEIPIEPIKDNSNFKGWISSGNDLKFNSILKGVFSEYNLPKDVVEETTIVDKIKDVVSVGSNDNSIPKDNSNLVKIALLLVGGYLVYKLVKK
jgi:hypothetical protein